MPAVAHGVTNRELPGPDIIATMRMWPVMVLAVVATGLGWLGPTGAGSAPTPLVVSPPRARVEIPAPPSRSPLASDVSIPEIEASLVVAGLDRPTFAVATDDGRLLVTEKAGVILVVVDGRILAEPLAHRTPRSTGRSGLPSMQRIWQACKRARMPPRHAHLLQADLHISSATARRGRWRVGSPAFVGQGEILFITREGQIPLIVLNLLIYCV